MLPPNWEGSVEEAPSRMKRHMWVNRLQASEVGETQNQSTLQFPENSDPIKETEG